MAAEGLNGYAPGEFVYPCWCNTEFIPPMLVGLVCVITSIMILRPMPLRGAALAAKNDAALVDIHASGDGSGGAAGGGGGGEAGV
jgi:hypothetical protein